MSNTNLDYYLASLEQFGIIIETGTEEQTKTALCELIDELHGDGLMEGTIKSIAKQALSCLED